MPHMEAAQMKVVSVTLGANWWDTKHQSGLPELLRLSFCLIQRRLQHGSMGEARTHLCSGLSLKKETTMLTLCCLFLGV